MSKLSTYEDSETGVKTIVRAKVPRRYKVLLHNDDYTTMEFVIYVLEKYFGKSVAEAQAIMMKVHAEGIGICGVYTLEIAETKVSQVSQCARSEGHPLKCSYEPE